MPEPIPHDAPAVKVLTGLRRVIADRMMESLATSAQLSFHREVDITHLMERRASWKAQGRNLSLEDCTLWSLARVLAKYPDFNGIVEGNRFLLERHVQLCVAISVSGALVTPIIRDADIKSVEEIAATRSDFLARAKLGALQVSEMKGGTVTQSNLGATGVQFFTPILNNGQILLLGMGRTDTRLRRTAAGDMCDRTFLNLSLTADHRIIDGLAACEVFNGICTTLADFDRGTGRGDEAAPSLRTDTS